MTTESTDEMIQKDLDEVRDAMQKEIEGHLALIEQALLHRSDMNPKSALIQPVAGSGIRETMCDIINVNKPPRVLIITDSMMIRQVYAKRLGKVVAIPNAAALKKEPLHSINQPVCMAKHLLPRVDSLVRLLGAQHFNTIIVDLADIPANHCTDFSKALLRLLEDHRNSSPWVESPTQLIMSRFTGFSRAYMLLRMLGRLSHEKQDWPRSFGEFSRRYGRFEKFGWRDVLREWAFSDRDIEAMLRLIKTGMP